VTTTGGGIDEAALASLEFSTVIDRIARQSTCAPGAAAVRSLLPRLGAAQWARDEHALVDSAVAFFDSGGSIGFSGTIDVVPFIDAAEKGASLGAADLRHISAGERALRSAVGALRAQGQPSTPLASLALQRKLSDELIADIERRIEEDGSISDSASPALSTIRRQQRTLHAQVRERCRTIIHNTELSKMLSESVVTVRAGRYVVPVKSEFASQFPGVVHDQSASGATVYVEPLASVEANNRLRALEAEEQREIIRILAELSNHVGAQGEALRSNAALLARLDSIAARARWARTVQAGSPDLVDAPKLRIVDGRHPLLRHTAVPLDFDIGEGWDAVVVSGPNMGGKTVVLKTVGLFCLLAYSGIPLPAAAGTTIGNFQSIDCIIGDEQSIAEDLSSFSAHVRALKRATAHAASHSLILVDEIGSGTEPAAGAALAQACIEAMIRAGAKVIVTTHFTQLKTFAAAHDRVRNASMLFDPHTNAPTYLFAMGVPGQSLAFSLARSIELDPRIVTRAEALLGSDAQNLERAFEQLAADRSELRRMQTELAQARQQTERLQDSQRKKIAALEQEREAFEKRAAAALEKAVDDLSRDLAARAQQRSDVARKQAAKPPAQSDRLLAETLSEMRRSLGLERAPVGGARPTLNSGDSVYVRSFDRSGVVSEIYGSDVLVTMGNLKTLVPISEVEPNAGKNAERVAKTNAAGSGSSESMLAEATTSVDVRGMRVDEAWPLIDKALDNAALTGLNELRVVHGKGTGRLSHGLRERLSGHPQVDSLANAADREGGSGVTVVKLK